MKIKSSNILIAIGILIFIIVSFVLMNPEFFSEEDQMFIQADVMTEFGVIQVDTIVPVSRYNELLKDRAEMEKVLSIKLDNVLDSLRKK